MADDSFDRSTVMFNPEGRVLQTEYATRAVYHSRTAIGIQCTDGIVLAVECSSDKLKVKTPNPRLVSVHRHCGMALAGLASDGRQIVARARHEAISYERIHGEPIPCKELAECVASFMHLYTLFEEYRPFGCGIILGGADRDGPQLYVIKPTGSCYKCFGAALGYGKRKATILLDRLTQGGTEIIGNCEYRVGDLPRIINRARLLKRETLQLAVSWLRESNMEFCPVPQDLIANAVEAYFNTLNAVDSMESLLSSQGSSGVTSAGSVVDSNMDSDCPTDSDDTDDIPPPPLPLPVYYY